MLINCHVHIHEYGKDFHEDYGREALTRLRGIKHWKTGKDWRMKDLAVDVETLIDDMDQAGVDKAWISGYFMRPMNCVNEQLSDFLCSLRDRYPDRLEPMISPDPIGGLKSVREVERGVHSLGMRVVGEVLPAYNYVAPNDHRMYPLYEICQDLGLPVQVHTGWSYITGGKSVEMTHPSLFEHVLFDFPQLKVILAHSGAIWTKEALIVLMKFPSAYCDLAYWQVYPIQWLADLLVWAKSLGVIDRVIWGTDYPYMSFEADLKRLRRIPEYTEKHEMEPGISFEEIEAILAGNAQRLINSVKV